jgi:hypothetical protein
MSARRIVSIRGTRFAPERLMSEYIRSFRDIGLGDVPIVGGKIPDGFAVTSRAYHEILRSADAVLKTTVRILATEEALAQRVDDRQLAVRRGA